MKNLKPTIYKCAVKLNDGSSCIVTATFLKKGKDKSWLFQSKFLPDQEMKIPLAMGNMYTMSFVIEYIKPFLMSNNKMVDDIDFELQT